MLKIGHLNPNWARTDYTELPFKYDTPSDTGNFQLTHEYMKAGHNYYNMSMYNYFEPNPMPAFVNYIKSQFSHFKNISAALNLFKPGQYLPYHVDLFERYKKVNNIVDEQIVRVIVMLEDSHPGQISHVCDSTIGDWRAGDWFQWDAADYHTFYNLSLHNRYAVQITGTI